MAVGQSNLTRSNVTNAGGKVSSLRGLRLPKPNRPKARNATTDEGEKPFGVVGRLASAPVNIGTTIRSVPMSEAKSKTGVVVRGRDFVTTIAGVSTSYSGWVPSGGFPVSPACLTASVLKGYFLTYELFRFRKLVLHYISSSPTSLAGDILMLHHANRGGPYVDHNSVNFMSYALSTPSAILGPQWLNKSVEVQEIDAYGWLYTDLFNSEDVAHQAAGEVLVYTRNTTNGTQADSPGYLLIDYEVEFTKRMVNPRSVIMPTNLNKIWMGALRRNGATVVINEPIALTPNGVCFDGTTGVTPPGAVDGCIFKVGLDTASSLSWTGINLNNFAVVSTSRTGAGALNNSEAFVLKNGMTLYLVYYATTDAYYLYASYEAALTGQPLFWGVNSTVTFNLPCWMSLVGSLTPAFTQASI